MYIALNGTLTANRVPWPEFARLAARTGYLGVDVNISAAMEAGLDATRSLLAELRIKPAVVGLPVEFRKDEETFKREFAGLEEAAKFSRAIGCPRMTTWVPSWSDIPKAELRKIWGDRFRACGEVLAKHGVRFGLEYLGPLHLRKRSAHEFIYRMDETLAWTKELGPNVGVLLDSWHWHHAGGTIGDIIAAGKDRIVHVQVADAPKVPAEDIRDNERLLPGEGILDWKGFFGALKKIGYTDGISPEVFGRGLKDMLPEEGAKLGLKFTSGVMRKAGVLS